MSDKTDKIIRNLAKVNWAYHEWWESYGDEIVLNLSSSGDTTAADKIREFRKLRSAVTTALAQMAEFVRNNSTE